MTSPLLNSHSLPPERQKDAGEYVNMSHISYLCQDSEYVVAVRNYITEDRTLLNFHKGDIIRLQHMDGLEAGETHTHTHTLIDMLLWNVHALPYQYILHTVLQSVCVHFCCTCLGKQYGCIVRKKVMLLEELKRDTSEFGEFDRDDEAGGSSACVCIFTCPFFFLLYGYVF